ncbi:hypothetical protein [Mesorhizobium sp. Z1-4]|uniref:hypothetical protein n=1 Tax=Mesorhizobium sp. Z1-4 TaxID=2448478 RepID=UPI000FD7DA3A|nr:hypothetical protein [Mesorhizobium sp. Z1-4]
MAQPNSIKPDSNELSSRRLVDPNDANPLGSADVDEMVSVAHENLGVDPEIDVPSDRIAIQAIAKAVSARIRNDAFSSDRKVLSAFLISDRSRADAEQLSAQREPIVDNGSIAFSGSLWIAGPAFRRAYRHSFSHANTSEIFEEIEDLGLGNSRIFLFDPNATDFEIRYYPYGISDADTVQIFLIWQHEFSIEALDRVLQRFYETSIRTPDAKIGPEGPWSNPAKYVPRPETEAFLQNWMKIAINVGFQAPYSCEFEKPGTEGRCDLMLVSKHPTLENTQIHHAVMELKVLRSRTSGDNPVSETVRREAVEKGLKQAIAYKNEQNAELAMLCCFDMRTVAHCDNDGCLEPIAAPAKTAGIELRRYRMYGSSDDHRNETYGASSHPS